MVFEVLVVVIVWLSFLSISLSLVHQHQRISTDKLLLKSISSVNSMKNELSLSQSMSSRKFTYCRTIVNMGGYVPPEEDKEYRTNVKVSLRRPTREERESAGEDMNPEVFLPIPSEGDIVLCQGKWQGEMTLGRVRVVQYNTAKSCWNAEIVPLCEGKSNNVYIVDKKAKLLIDNIANIKVM